LTRVLHVLDKISVDSGVSAVVMNYYNKLDHKKLTFDFMLNEDLDAETRAYIEGNGSKIFIMPGLRVANLFKYIRALRAFYKAHDYRIVHGHVANSAVFYLGLARKKVPFRIIHSHNTMSSDIFWKRIRNWVLTRFIKRVANRYMACSERAAMFLFGSSDNVTIINNAIDIERFLYDEKKRERIRHELSIDDKQVIGHIGRFSAQKNHGFLIEVFSKLHKENPNVILLLIGNGELYNGVVQKVKERKLDDAVIFTGSVSNVDDYMNAMDVFVLPSLFEGLPLTGVEAQINGLPCFFSSEITKEIQITDSARFLLLSDTKIWCDEIAHVLGQGRADKSDIQMQAFDINVQVKGLMEYYGSLEKGSA